ncbi:MAG: B12-binding domain-containing radical SAM protein [Coriobacteriia bacterium]|nr:B12-binding domain-containing radical SAM protein [Coriobacteriia bacterium]
MRILLINSPVSRLSPHARVAPPLGIAYLAAHVRAHGHEVDILDFNISGYNPRRLALALKRFEPAIVGISAFTETYPNAAAIARQVKEYDPQITVVMGGPHPSILPDDVVVESGVDYVVVGEGEATLLELIDVSAGLKLPSDVAGLVWQRDGEVVHNPRRQLLDPDSLDLPARDLLSLEFYADPFNVLTARGGCPYRCPFCSASYIWSGKHRPRSPKAVVDELETLVRGYGASYLFFVDDIFTLRRDWVVELMGEMERLGGAITWGCGTRVDRVDEELIALMASHGCVGIQYGVESGSQTVLDSVKGIDKDAALDAVRMSVAAGIRTTASFMVPFPEDTEDTLRETFAFMSVLKDEGAEILMSYTTPYPGTAFFEQANELGITILSDDWGEYDAKHLVMETANLSAARIEEIVNEEAARAGLVKLA